MNDRKGSKACDETFQCTSFKEKKVSKFEDWTWHQFCLVRNDINVEPRLPSLNVVGSNAYDLDAHIILWTNSLALSPFSGHKKKKKHTNFCSKIGSTCLCNVPTVHFMFANIIIIITEKYSGCHRLLTLPWRQDNIELVIWWELIFHFWAKKEHKAFWTQGWKTSWSVTSWWLPWKFQLPMLYNYVQSHWQPAGHNFGLKYIRVCILKRLQCSLTEIENVPYHWKIITKHSENVYKRWLASLIFLCIRIHSKSAVTSRISAVSLYNFLELVERFFRT